MKRSQLEEVFRRKVRLKISRRRRGRFAINLTSDGLFRFEIFPNKRTALAALLARMRTMPDIIIEVRSVAGRER